MIVRKKYFCPHCKCEMKLKDMNGCSALYCPKCENAIVVEYPENFKNVQKDYYREMNKIFENIVDIRILPNDKGVFPREEDFEAFVKYEMVKRGGYYYFPNLMMHSGPNTLVLFQYDGKIRAYGILKMAVKEESFDEDGTRYAGYYLFDAKTLHYLKTPINDFELKKVWPDFKMFCQTKQRIPLKYLDDLICLLK